MMTMMTMVNDDNDNNEDNIRVLRYLMTIYGYYTYLRTIERHSAYLVFDNGSLFGAKWSITLEMIVRMDMY